MMPGRIKTVKLKPSHDGTPKMEVSMEFDKVDSEEFGKVMRTWSKDGSELLVSFAPMQTQLPLAPTKSQAAQLQLAKPPKPAQA